MTSKLKENICTNLPTRDIDLSRFDIRLGKETLKDEDFFNLVESVKQTGIQIPIHIVGHKGSYEVIDGGRRLRAAETAGLKTIPTMIIEDADAELEIRKRALIANVHRKDLEAEERGEALIKYYKCAGFNTEQTLEYLNKIMSSDKHKKDWNKLIPNSFAKLMEEIAIPPATQGRNIHLVNDTDEEVRSLAKKANLWHQDKMRLVTKEITGSKDKTAVKEAQKRLITSLAAARNTSRKFERRQSEEAIAREAENIAEAEKRPRRTMSAEETAEADEARRKDRMLNPHRLMGILNGGLSRTWEGLTQQQYIPAQVDSVTELKRDHIVPTREFRKDLANTIPKAERTLLKNWIIFVRMAMDDMEDILDKADTTAFDTRK
jgi:ParB-like nuclease domain